MTAKRQTLVMDHDDLIASLIAVRRRTERARVVAAFVVSLRAKRLDLRSPLGSYAYHLNHPLHKLVGFNPGAHSVAQQLEIGAADRVTVRGKQRRVALEKFQMKRIGLRNAFRGRNNQCR